VHDSYLEWKEWRGADFGQVECENSIYFERELRASGIASVVGLRVGELGYGNGAFAGWVRASKGLWVGREVVPELRDRAAEAGLKNIEAHETFCSVWGDSSFDLIVGFDVLEHMDLCAIRDFMREAKDALKPGALLLLRTPSGDSPFSSAIYRGDLTHRTLLGSSAVSQLAHEAGLEVHQIRSPVLPLAGHSALRIVRRVIVRVLQRLVFGFIRQILMANDSAILSSNMIAVLRRTNEVT
jgi:2-polyprenyl-3-methyl-5-hydroxy-6-metoxy-1,4-benzoquinol methylase